MLMRVIEALFQCVLYSSTQFDPASHFVTSELVIGDHFVGYRDRREQSPLEHVDSARRVTQVRHSREHRVVVSPSQAPTPHFPCSWPYTCDGPSEIGSLLCVGV